VFPGLGGYDAVVHNHGLCLDLEDKYFAEGVAPGSLDGNPVHEDLRGIIPHLPPIFILNVVLAEDKAPAYFVAGDVIKAHGAACDFVDKHFRCAVPRKADLILLSAGGHPRDISLYQAHKALKHAEAALSRRGRILFFAKCPDGMGHPHFEQWRELDFAATVSLLRQRYLPIGHIALSLRTLYKRFDLNLVSELDAAKAEEWGFEPVAPEKASLKAAWMLARADSPVVVTHGSSVLLSAGQ
jgi:nickel-dependent lactate racemase